MSKPLGSQESSCTQTADLVLLIARLVQQVRKFDPANDVAEKAMDYLRRHELQGSILREMKDAIVSGEMAKRTAQ